MRLTVYPNRIPAIYGSFIAIGLMVYFLIAYFGGFVHVIELRLLNFFILGGGIYAALRQFYRTHEHHVGFFHGFVIGISSSIIGVSTFVLLLFIILKLNDQLFVTVVKGEPMGIYLNVFMATFAVWFEGIFSGVMATFILVNFMSPTNPK
jgi:hypothetical protein